MDTKQNPLVHAVLAFLLNGEEVLLALKKVDAKIGPNTRNGYGGMIEDVDQGDVARAMLRELEEESGLHASADDLSLVAVVDFHTQKSDGTLFTCRVHTFLLTKWVGEVMSTAEMGQPKWYPLNTLPFGDMMPADSDWLPHALRGELFYAKVWYGPGQKEVLRPCNIQTASLGDLHRLRP